MGEHPFGLVFEDEHFVCEDCCRRQPVEKIKESFKTTMQNPESGMPIALWLLHEENKDKTMMTVKK